MGDMAEHDLFVPALLPPLKCCRRSLHLSQRKADGHHKVSHNLAVPAAE